MGGVGFTELLLLAVVALIVLGPEKLPGIARKAGQLSRQARRAWQGLQSELQAELDADHNRRIMEATAKKDEATTADGTPDGASANRKPADDDDPDASS